MAETTPQRETEIAHEREFLTLHEFVKVARIKLSSGVWDYLTGGSETETTLARNRLAIDSHRLPPARAARRVEDRLLRHALRQEAAHPGAVRAGRLDRGVRRRRRGRRGGGGAAVRRRIARQLGEPAGSREGRGRGAGRAHHLPALCPRRPRLGRRSGQARDRCRLRGVLLHHRHRDLQPARARPRQALPPDRPAQRLGPRVPGGAQLGRRQALQGQVHDPAASSRASPPPRMPRPRLGTASMRSMSRTMAGGSSITAAAPSRCCPRSSRR